jgi:hypothetical protein
MKCSAFQLSKNFYLIKKLSNKQSKSNILPQHAKSIFYKRTPILPDLLFFATELKTSKPIT